MIDKDMTRKLDALCSRISSVIMGKEQAVELAVSTLLSRGNLLIEDVPGVGKTTLAFTLARAIDCSFQRIQFTSDLLPSDIIGVSVFNNETREFEFKYGPLFANIVLADEINRTTPKTQSALLEAMNEKRVSVERTTHVLPEPFMVIATQNPLEYRGTFPLPESQLDRFTIHLRLGYPMQEFEKQAIVEQRTFHDIEAMGPVLGSSDVIGMQEAAERVRVEDSVVDYLISIVSATRTHEKIHLGVSTRGAQYFIRIAKAWALLHGRDYVVPDDVKMLAPHALAHRIILRRQSGIENAEMYIREIADKTPVPV